MKEMARYGFILGVICFSSALVLGLTYHFTRPAIEAQVLEEEKAGMKDVLGFADTFIAKRIGAIEYYEGRSKNNLAGFVLKAQAKGYGGPIDMMVGLDLNGQITGIKILSHSETPGLGSQITEIKTGEDSPWFLKQFSGRRPEDLSLRNMSAITAATITSKAVIDTVKEKAQEFLVKLQKQ